MRRVEKAYEITNARIQFVSLVDKAANKRSFLLTKAADGQASFTTYGRILKADATNHYVTGIVYEPMTEDTHGNFMTEEEITKAAYWFAKNGDKVDVQHSFEPLENAAVVENWIAKADFELGGEKVQKGTWLMTVEVTDDAVWEQIEKGEITGFSMGGLGNYSEEDTKLETVSKSKDESGEKKGLLKQLAKLMGFDIVEKGAMTELYEQRNKGNQFWTAIGALEDMLYRYDPMTGAWMYETDETKVRECLEDFGNIITGILTSEDNAAEVIQKARPLEKAGKKMSGKNKETLAGIYESLGAFLKEFDDPELTKDPEEDEKKEDEEVTKQEVEAIVTKAVAAAVAKATEAENAEEEKEKEQEEEEQKEVEKSDALTPESVTAMVEAAVQKAMTPQQESITMEQAQEMIEQAVAKAVEPVLKSHGVPTNLDSNYVEKSAGEEHYLHGIL